MYFVDLIPELVKYKTIKRKDWPKYTCIMFKDNHQLIKITQGSGDVTNYSVTPSDLNSDDWEIS